MKFSDLQVHRSRRIRNKFAGKRIVVIDTHAAIVDDITVRSIPQSAINSS
jgi:hypothetical protein